MTLTETYPETELIDDNSVEPMAKPTNYRWLWTQTGIDCHDSGADCANCIIFRTTGKHKDDPKNTCHQRSFNQNLLQRGIKRPANLNEGYKAPKRWKALSPSECYTLRQELFRLVSTMDIPTTRSMASALTSAQFLGREEWTVDIVNCHAGRMKKVGAINQKDRTIRSQGSLIWEPLDASKIMAPRNTAVRKVTPMPQMVNKDRSGVKG